jgi:hypothetical protein
MNTRQVQKSDQNGLDVGLDDFIVDEDFLVDGYEGTYAIATEGDDTPAYIAIGWSVEDDPWEFQKEVDGRADGLEVLNALSTILTVNALRALGFRHVLGTMSTMVRS